MKLVAKTLIGCVCFFTGALTSFVLTMAYQDYWFKCKDNEVKKFRDLFNCVSSWIAYRQSGQSLAKKLYEYGFKRVAIYGIGKLGELVIQELQKEEIDVVYGIDKNANIMYRDLPLYTPDDDFPEADVIIVTPVSAYDEITQNLRKKTKIPTISINALV